MELKQGVLPIMGAITFSLFVLYGCGSTSSPRRVPSASTPVVTNPVFETDIKKVIDSNCGVCHDGKATDNTVDLSTYALVKAKAVDIATVTKQTHHQITWTAATKELFQNWIDDGFKSTPTTATTTTADSPATTNSTLTYTKNIVPIFSKCVTCHISGKWSPPLATYSEAKTFGGYATEWISAKGTHSSVSITADEVKTFADWVAAGYPE